MLIGTVNFKIKVNVIQTTVYSLSHYPLFTLKASKEDKWSNYCVAVIFYSACILLVRLFYLPMNVIYFKLSQMYYFTV